jgi:hypothetical protein
VLNREGGLQDRGKIESPDRGKKGERDDLYRDHDRNKGEPGHGIGLGLENGSYDAHEDCQSREGFYLMRASAWYYCAYKQELHPVYPPLISLPWVVFDVLCKIKSMSH